MSRRHSAIPDECWNCPLPDCYPTDARCPVLRRKAQDKGLTLPDVPKDAPVSRPGRPCAPSAYRDRKDYQRQYKRNDLRVSLRGIKIRRCDAEILQSVCAADGRTLESEIATLLELMAQAARTRGKG